VLAAAFWARRWDANLRMVVVASRMIADAFLEEVVCRIVVNRGHLYHMSNFEPENSDRDQFLFHDNCKLSSSPELAHGELHHQPEGLHIHDHPHRSPHKRVDRSKNFAASPHNVAPPTKNFFSDSHWQQSRNVRLNYIWERSSPWEDIHRHPQN